MTPTTTARLASMHARAHYDRQIARLVTDILTMPEPPPIPPTRALDLLQRASRAELPERNPLDADGRPIISRCAFTGSTDPCACCHQ